MSDSTSTTSGKSAGEQIKGVFAGVHGAGEAIRGTFNKGVDDTFNAHGGQNQGVAKNEAVAQQGINELETGKFSSNTKSKETTKEGYGI